MIHIKSKRIKTKEHFKNTAPNEKVYIFMNVQYKFQPWTNI